MSLQNGVSTSTPTAAAAATSFPRLGPENLTFSS
jgi:hypothetical protein